VPAEEKLNEIGDDTWAISSEIPYVLCTGDHSLMFLVSRSTEVQSMCVQQ
jgi:hypothetical protein